MISNTQWVTLIEDNFFNQYVKNEIAKNIKDGSKETLLIEILQTCGNVAEMEDDFNQMCANSLKINPGLVTWLKKESTQFLLTTMKDIIQKYGDEDFSELLCGCFTSFVNLCPYIEYEQPATQHQCSLKKEESKLSRTEAQSLCHKHNQDLKPPFNIAKRNSGNDLYWANPNIDVLEQNWTLLLNDQHSRQLHVIKIPANTFKKDQFYIKDNDKLNVLINPYTLLNKGPLSEQCDFGKYEVAVIKY